MICTGHMFGWRSTRRSIAGSFWRSSYRPNGTEQQDDRRPMIAHDPPGLRAVDPQEAEARGDAAAATRVSSTNPVASSLRPGSGSDSGTPKRITKKTRLTAIAGIDRVSGDVAAERLEQATGGQRSGDRAELERDHEQAGGASGRRRRHPAAAAAVEDQRDLERQPDRVEALQRPGDQERGEVAGEQQPPARGGRDRGRDQQHLLVAEHVAELREDRARRGPRAAAAPPRTS